MTVEILIPIALGESARTTRERFETLVEVVDAWSGASGAWRGLRFEEPEGGSAGDDEIRDVEGLVEVLRGREPVHVLAYTSFPCHRFFSGTAESSGVGMWAEARGAEVALRIHSAGPFSAELGTAGADEAAGHNRFVAENLEALTDLCFHLAQSLQARRLAIFTDVGSTDLWNAHLAWFAGDDEAAAAIGELTSPAPGGGQADCLHPWRSPDQRAELGARLERTLSGARSVGPDAVRTVRKSGEFDVYETDRGFAVLQHPWFINGFVDRFVTDVLAVR